MRSATAIRVGDLVHPELLAFTDDLLRLTGWAPEDVGNETLFSLAQRTFLEMPAATSVPAGAGDFPVLGATFARLGASAVTEFCDALQPPGAPDIPPGQTVFAFLRRRFAPLTAPPPRRPKTERREHIVRQRRRNRR